LVVLDDPISIVLGIGGVVALAAGIVMAVLLHRPAGRGLIVVGLAMIAGAAIYTLVASWLMPGS
jgi:hypothetical protein